MRSVLANPPRIIEQSQRIKFGAILGITEMAETAFRDLSRLAEDLCDPEMDALDQPSNRHRALSLAWGIVDQADLLRDLIISEGDKISMLAANQFIEIAAPVREMRNWLRHIPQRVGNYVSAKRPVPPVLGALSYTVLRRWNGALEAGAVLDANVIEYHTVVLVNSWFERDGSFDGVPIRYVSFRHPVDHFVLQAFGTTLPLGPLVHSISHFCDEFAAGVNRFLEAEIVRRKAEGEDVQSAILPLYALGAGTYRMVARRD